MTDELTYLAAHAPREIPFWYQVSMPDKPAIPDWRDISDVAIREDVQCALDCDTDAISDEAQAWLQRHQAARKALDEWELEQLKRRQFTWPWHWAGMMLKSRELAPYCKA